jgi:hypothetical protein
MASVPWRKANMLRLADTAESQGFPLLLILDGYSLTDVTEVKDHLSGKPIIIIATKERGHVLRWRLAADLERFVIIDDDLNIEPGFFTHGLDELARTGARLISWGGWLSGKRHKNFNKPIPQDKKLEIFHACIVFGYGVDIAEFWASEFATAEMMDKYSSLDDEALVSAFYKSRNKLMICPAGPSYVTEVIELSHDERRLYNQARGEMPRLRKELGLQC